ncbi:MAG: hypothetical protein KatS3mg101_0934 [Patescibacteria group bacterium]|nr:MAG: hypothetical protein KatS3mg101_0934 [Patescibacteria group bacterium]
MGAEKYTDYIDEFVTIRYEKYDMKTGKRQYVWKYTCPKKRWWNNHSSFMAGVVMKKENKTKTSKKYYTFKKHLKESLKDKKFRKVWKRQSLKEFEKWLNEEDRENWEILRYVEGLLGKG